MQKGVGTKVADKQCGRLSSWLLSLLFRAVNPFFWGMDALNASEQSIKNGRDIRSGNCRPFLSGNRPPALSSTTHSAVLSTDTFLWRRLGSFHGDLIPWLVGWLGCTRRQIWS